VPVFGFGIRPRGPEHTTEAADERHHVGRGDGQIEVHVALLNGFGEVVGADDVGSGVASLLCCLTGGEHGTRTFLPVPSGRATGATDHLIRLAGVDAEPDGDVDTFVERGLGQRLGQAHGLGGREQLVPVEGLGRIYELLS
jgi:hypothetical protein